MVHIHPAYRDAVAGAQLRYDEQLAGWNDRLSNLSAVERVHAARSGRIAAGSIGVAGALLVPVVGLLDLALHRVDQGDMVAVLLGIWPAMGLAWLLGRRVSRGRLSLAARAPEATGDPFTDLARLGAERPARRLHDLAHAQERASVALPLMALSLLSPLSIHMALTMMFALVTGRLEAPASFAVWIGISILVVGHAHLVLAGFGWSFAKRLAGVRDADLLAEADRSSRRAFWWTVLASAIPSGVLYLIPPIVTAITGALFCGPIYRRVAASVLRERELLGRHSAER